MGKHARQLQEDPGHPDPWVTKHRGERAKPPQRNPRRSDKGVGVEHPAQYDVHEEALGGILRLREVTMLEVSGDHAAVVRPVPGREVG